MPLKRRGAQSARWASAPSYPCSVITVVGSAGVQSHASNEFPEFVAHHATPGSATSRAACQTAPLLTRELATRMSGWK